MARSAGRRWRPLSSLAAITFSHTPRPLSERWANENAKDAARVVGWLAEQAKCETVKLCKGGTVSKRDIHVKVFGGSRTVEEVSAVCRLLVEHGYLRSAGPSWRRDSQLFEVNPDQGERNGDA